MSITPKKTNMQECIIIMKGIGHAIRLAIDTVTLGLTVLNGLLAMMEWATRLYIENMHLEETNKTINTIQR